MELNTNDQNRLKRLIQNGLPLTSAPYKVLAEQLNVPEHAVINTIRHWQNNGDIRRFGVVVNHPKLGYIANAMIVWDIPDHLVEQIGRAISDTRLVSLCYRRPRRLPTWPYNLFCMIHSRSRDHVHHQLEALINQCGLSLFHHQILFSTRQFKQCAGQYASAESTPERRTCGSKTCG